MTDPLLQKYDDEIELIDIFRILWKWKIFIAAGVLACGVVAVVICYSMEKIYKVSMTVQPGIMYSTEEGKRIFIDSIETIVARIDAGIYNDAIIDHALKVPAKDKPEDIDIRVETPSKSDVFLVSYETADPKEGLAVLNELFRLLNIRESELIKYIIENLNRKINLDTIELEKKKEIEKSYIINVQTIEKRIKEINEDIQEINKNSVYLSEERKKLLNRNTDDQGALAVLLYSNTIQQNIEFVNTVKKDLNEHQMLKEDEMQKIIREKNEQKKIAEQIEMNIMLRDNVVKMAMIKVPTVAKYPVKPQKRMILFLSLTVGLFAMIFLSFLIEYIKNNPICVNNELPGNPSE
ncbi:MAG: hypothetical protein KKD44_19825 [Proteobacteria bacterium]|nr:hypothetical protein [Pseudomonadota bacterium]